MERGAIPSDYTCQLQPARDTDYDLVTLMKGEIFFPHRES